MKCDYIHCCLAANWPAPLRLCPMAFGIPRAHKSAGSAGTFNAENLLLMPLSCFGPHKAPPHQDKSRSVLVQSKGGERPAARE